MKEEDEKNKHREWFKKKGLVIGEGKRKKTGSESQAEVKTNMRIVKVRVTNNIICAEKQRQVDKQSKYLSDMLIGGFQPAKQT